MAEATMAWPKKTREMHNHHIDSTIWNDFRFRDGDIIIIGTYGKSGTTWVQQIVAQLLFNGQEGLDVHAMSPWFDNRVSQAETLAAVEAQTHRRFLKTHLPVEALVLSPRARYMYIGRDGRDVVWSFYNHHANANEAWYKRYNDTPGRVGPPIDKPPASIRQYFHDWLDRDGHPFWPFWEHIRSWWDIQRLPNVLLLHFAVLKEDMPGQMRRIAAFLDIPIDETKWEAIVGR